MVADDELLYRRVICRAGLEPFKVVDGKVKFGSQAFGDPDFQPSVDRAAINENDPSKTQLVPTNGVTSLIASDVRKISSVTKKDKADTIAYLPNVVPDAIAARDGQPENLAHALVVTEPKLPSSNVFYKLQVALALLASSRGWSIAPSPSEEPGP